MLKKKKKKEKRGLAADRLNMWNAMHQVLFWSYNEWMTFAFSHQHTPFWLTKKTKIN